MNTDHVRFLCRALFLATGCTLVPASIAQTAPRPSASAASLPANTSVPVQLQAFEVQEDSDTSYGALNSNSITQFNIELSKLPVTADIFTETFMKDIAAYSVEEMIMESMEDQMPPGYCA